MNKFEREALRKEMQELQSELKVCLGGLMKEFGSKLSAEERVEIEAEIKQINEVVDRLKSGRVWLALFGKTGAGKSAVVNSLQRADVAVVGVENDLTRAPKYYEHGISDESPYMIVDVPGIMGKLDFEIVAIEEAKKAHGHIFVVDQEPYQDELELFDLVARATPDSPRLVLVNKVDRLEHMPASDRKTVVDKIMEKMGKYVESTDDIVFGSAQRYDKAGDVMVRQDLPSLENRLYDNVGTLGQIVNVFDPAKRAEQAVGTARKKIFEMRKRLARKLIQGFALAEAGSSIIPFADIVTTPGLLFLLTRAVLKVMGGDVKVDSKQATWDILKVCMEFMTASFVIATIGGVAVDALGPIGWLLSFAGLATLKYTRTLVFGEALLLYIENDFSFGDGAAAMVRRAKTLAGQHYRKFARREKR